MSNIDTPEFWQLANAWAGSTLDTPARAAALVAFIHAAAIVPPGPAAAACVTCSNVMWDWDKTPGGKLRNKPNTCTAESIRIVPVSVRDVNEHRNAIWPGDGANCPFYKEKQ